MASVDLVTYAGASSSATAGKSASVDAWTVSGAELSAARVAWGGTPATRSRVDWLPNPQTPVLNPNGTMHNLWYRFFAEVAHTRLGGIDGQTVPQVVTVQTQTQTQVLSVQTQSTKVAQAVGEVTHAVNIARQVAVDNDLSGADQIPIVDNPKLLTP